MSWWTKLTDALGGSVVDTVGKGAGNLMDRFGFTTKMSDAEKIDKTIELIKATIESDKLDADDLKSAREMAIVQMQTQKASWLVRQLNGALRPCAGWIALICMTDKWWGQLLERAVGIVWVPIQTTPAEEFILGGILAFFFGFRQRAKEKQVNLNA